MECESRGAFCSGFGERDLGEEIVAAGVDRAESLEVGSVMKSLVFESVVKAIEVEGGGAGRWPDVKIEGLGLNVGRE